MDSKVLIVGIVVGSIAILGVMVVNLLVLLKRRRRKRKKGLEKKYGFILVLNLTGMYFQGASIGKKSFNLGFVLGIKFGFLIWG